MIKAVIFDVGGVLLRTQDHGPRRRWERQLGLQDWESEQIVFSGEMGTAAQQGVMDDGELWTWIGRHLQLEDEQLKQFRQDFWSGDVLDEELINLIRRLRAEYQTAIISNATDYLRRLLENEHKIADAFDLVVCSAEEKVMKPDSEIYLRTLQRLEREPQEAVFIDDNLDNVSAARNLGMWTIHYHEGLNVEEELAGLGVTIRNRDERLTGEQNHA